MQDETFVIDIHNIHKSFAGKTVVNGVSLQVNAGEIYGFLGPNGSGKTTTIRMLCGLLTPDSGEGTCLGYDILKESYAIKRHSGYMAQHFSLYEDLSIYENLDFIARIYAMDNRQERIEKSIEELGLQHRRQQLTGSLSGGWKQRLALAAALIHDPKLLLLDEPTAGVDPKARRDFWDQIHVLSQRGITTLVSTHYMDEAERCHRLAYMMNGVLIIHGTLQEIIDQTHLSTWEITGKNLAELSVKLRQMPYPWQVTAFGNTLHVSYLDNSLEAEIRKFQATQWNWKKINASLEDVFVHMSANQNKE